MPHLADGDGGGKLRVLSWPVFLYQKTGLVSSQPAAPWVIASRSRSPSPSRSAQSAPWGEKLDVRAGGPQPDAVIQEEAGAAPGAEVAMEIEETAPGHDDVGEVVAGAVPILDEGGGGEPAGLASTGERIAADGVHPVHADEAGRAAGGVVFRKKTMWPLSGPSLKLGNRSWSPSPSQS